jgi:hypothetical protein
MPTRFSNLVAVTLAIAMLAAIGFGLVLHRPESVVGQGASYEYKYRTAAKDSQGVDTYVVGINILNQQDDYGDYKSENDSRIAGWVADPDSAPALTGRPVKITFDSAMSYTDTMEIISPVASSYLQYRLVGYSASYPDRSMDGIGPIDPIMIGSVVDPACGVAVDPVGQPDPTGCEVITYTGVIHVVFSFSGTITDLDDLRAHSDVYLIDTTGIQVVQDLSLLYGIALSQMQVVSFPSPMLRN